MHPNCLKSKLVWILLYRLSIKYGQTTEEMLAFLEKCRQELNQINHSEETLIQLNETYEILKERRFS